jgi:hypothetical protein
MLLVFDRATIPILFLIKLYLKFQKITFDIRHRVRVYGRVWVHAYINAYENIKYRNFNGPF